MKIVALPYWGSLAFWRSLDAEGEATLASAFSYADFPKGAWNRTAVQDVRGRVHLLSFPIAGGRKNKLPVKDIKIDGSVPWQQQHIATLQTCYGKCIFWEEYGAHIRQLLLENQSLFLLDFNWKIYEWLSQFVELPAIALPLFQQTTHPSEARNVFGHTHQLLAEDKASAIDVSILHYVMYMF